VISTRLKEVILRQLDLDQLELDETMEANAVPGWDSLSHVSILAAVEKEFGIRFKMLETLRLKNIGDLQRLIDAKLSPSK
jgi:acyl carrier protein